jgi:hypothetical protein
VEIGNRDVPIIEGRESSPGEKSQRGKGGPQENKGRRARDRRPATTSSETVALML